MCACVIPVTFQQPYNFMEMRNGFSWVPVFNLDTSQLNEQVGMLSVVNKELQNTMHSSLKAESRNKTNNVYCSFTVYLLEDEVFLCFVLVFFVPLVNIKTLC